jgi:hypothetical protein
MFEFEIDFDFFKLNDIWHGKIHGVFSWLLIPTRCNGILEDTFWNKSIET